MKLLDRSGYAQANLPRYTSYPTAPHFGPLEEATYRGWLSRMPPAEALSLYVHIPFCHELCWYCGCHTSVTRNEERIARYAEALHREARLLALALPADGIVQHLHLGGGTPSALGAARLSALMGKLRALYPFARHAELSIELDPRTLTEEVVATLAREGFTRASLGLQDANPEVQELMGRIQPAEMVRTAVERLRAAGVSAINLDMMYGLPGQSRAHVAATAALAAELGADRVSVFGYAHVPWMKPAQKAILESDLPDAAARMEQAQEASDVLRAAGFVPIGLDHFARPADPMARAAAAGRLRRNFQGYTTDDAPMLLGLGASSIGAVPQGYAQNIPDERGYVAAVEAGKLPVIRGLALTGEDIIRRAAIERVMCDLALDLDTLPAAVLQSALPGLQGLERDGLVRLAGAWLTVPDEARPFLRHVASCFDARLNSGNGRHSAAV
ncbi:oxygen-independent coproporphyrinogen III oxidase [Roseococcus microcysteis]|uniref:oxygen-independent coproporphyrinogen III oxidase n=1 Tax=Roseococcus microcysteis TaxID=2771361 RepID=UPI00168A6D8E|nr:oxygen-independent coproporphyrinogen III oxidase [Roseococcus microcysteis]